MQTIITVCILRSEERFEFSLLHFSNTLFILQRALPSTRQVDKNRNLTQQEQITDGGMNTRANH